MNELDKLFWNAFASPVETNFPPYDIITEGNDFRLQFAVAGFSLDELDIEYDGKSLIVSGTHKKQEPKKQIEYFYHGISNRNFRQTLAVRGQFEVGDVWLENGILTIMMKDKAERIKPKIQIRDGLKTYVQPALEDKVSNQ